MTLPDWTKVEDWDALYLNSRRVPGVVKVNVELPSGLDKKKARGRRKTRITDDGAPAAEVDITVELLPEECEAFESFVNLLRPRQDSTPREPINAGHPALAFWGIYKLLIGKVRSPHPTQGGTFIVNISAEEWVPEPKKTAKPKNKPAEASTTTADVDALIADLTPAQQAAALSSFEPDDPDAADLLQSQFPGSF